MQKYDYLVFGAGIYGLYATKFLAEKGLKVALIEFDKEPLIRASYINQARVHNGYHYPRSVSTAAKSANYYQRFSEEFSFAVNKEFLKVYAISATDSLTNSEQFENFCEYVNIPAIEINSKNYFNKGTVEAAYETTEFTYDANIIRKWFVEELKKLTNVDVFYGMRLMNFQKDNDCFCVNFQNQIEISSPRVLNATYASINQILNFFKYDLFNIKYEICEIILTRVNSKLKNVGITVMDGPFFSVMPFGFSGTHSLTSVGHTPHETSYNSLPTYSCQSKNKMCTPTQLQNCNLCPAKPESAWTRMHQLSKKYLVPDIEISYIDSLWSVKAIMNAAELDDSRPTVIRKFEELPSFISVLSGKFNTIYDLEDALL
ncbi:FAD-dependent oxidoreductase [Paenibacillus mesotrionivorans]|uniref:FAD-dependent oxidoreductase n=1 Tax=Paenibacillus mesotrionivorans TaxID=3160968 RepID=A0ACC7NWC2_9BACL